MRATLVKESLSQSQDCGKLVLVKVKSNLRVSIYLYWFHGQEFILQLQLYTYSNLAFCLRRVWTVSCHCQRLTQNLCIISNFLCIISNLIHDGTLLRQIKILLQNATAFLLQNATEVYYKMRQDFYNKMRQLLQNVTFITSCDITN